MKVLEPTNRRTELGANIAWGLRWASWYVAGYSVFVILLYLVAGSAPFAAKGITLIEVLAVYLLGGAAAGFVVGVSRPLLKSAWGAVMVGVVAGIPVGIGLAIIVVPEPLWSGEHSFVAAGIALLLGGGCGMITHQQFADGENRRK